MVADTPKLRTFLAAHEGKTLAQLSAAWEAEQKQRVSVKTFHKTLQRLGYTRKKSATTTAKVTPRSVWHLVEHSPNSALRVAFTSTRLELRKPSTTLTPIALKASQSTPNVWVTLQGRVSMIAAWCQGKVFTPMNFTGYCDSLLVETWFAKVLLPKLRPGQPVILDNASFHRKATMPEAIGCHLLPLPPYSPELNRIESLWHRIKSLVGHNHHPDLTFPDKVEAAFCSL